jgi:hypothetical protein
VQLTRLGDDGPRRESVTDTRTSEIESFDDIDP